MVVVVVVLEPSRVGWNGIPWVSVRGSGLLDYGWSFGTHETGVFSSLRYRRLPTYLLHHGSSYLEQDSCIYSHTTGW